MNVQAVTLEAMRRLLLILCFALWTLNGSPAIAAEEHTLRHDGRERNYLAVMPETEGNTSLPVVIALHGGGGDPEAFIERSRLDALARREGFIAIFPAGTGRLNFLTWNAGHCCGYAHREQVDDVGFLKRVITHISIRYPVDPERIYMTGHSNGSMMTYHALCQLADQLAAVAPVGGQKPYPGCPLSRRVPLLHLHGSEDKSAPYHGGECGGGWAEILPFVSRDDITRQCQPVPATVRQWAQAYGCEPPAQQIRSEAPLHCSRYCSGAAPVTLCRIEGAGHAWPGGTPFSACERREEGFMCQRWRKALGSPEVGVDASRFIWKWLKQYHK